MSRLTIFADTEPTFPLLEVFDAKTIAAELAKIGVRFEQWTTAEPLPKDADDSAVLKTYAREIEKLVEAEGYRSVDVIRMLPDNEKRQELRTKFLAEHIHEDDEVRFFVEGTAMFYLRTQGMVHMVRCDAGDLINVPCGTRHWFDMGPTPYFTAIRLFSNPDGWIAKYTGEDIALSFPRFEPAVAA